MARALGYGVQHLFRRCPCVSLSTFSRFHWTEHCDRDGLVPQGRRLRRPDRTMDHRGLCVEPRDERLNNKCVVWSSVVRLARA